MASCESSAPRTGDKSRASGSYEWQQDKTVCAPDPCKAVVAVNKFGQSSDNVRHCAHRLIQQSDVGTGAW